jgi:hypothetical protein
MSRSVLNADEENVMKMTLKSAMLRAAEIVERITESDVVDAQEQMLSEGVSLEKVAKVDRAMLAAAHLRAIANKER